jgi:predicted alpha/beta-fold hydrolase
VLAQLAEWFPNSRRGLIGFSLGANMTLKFVGEQGADGRNWVDTAVAVSPSFDLQKSVDLLSHPLFRLYVRYFLTSLRPKIKAKAALLDSLVDVDRLLAARTFREFDDAGTAPLNGFRDANDYYQKCSTAQFLPHIQLPTLILRALDDPLYAADDVPYDFIDANPSLTAAITPQGGHMGFVAGRPGRFNCWAEQEATRFMAAHLLEKTSC